MLRLPFAATSAFALLAVLTLAPAPAHAHFVLQSPASWMSQDGLGSPQKLGPCGDEGGGTATGTVTAFHPGDTVTITVNETIFHPGHYRIALAQDPTTLPPEPPVTAGSTPCGSVPVMSPAVYPVLADGVLTHTSPFSGPQTVHVQLPTNVTCTKCTLQIIEFMSDHPLNNPGGCFYHHCANISIEGPVSDGGNAGNPDSGSSGGDDASSGGGGDDASSGGGGHDGGSGGSMDNAGNAPSGSSGGCAMAAAGESPVGLALAGLGLVVAAALRRRR